jgi:hypothetical protein
MQASCMQASHMQGHSQCIPCASLCTPEGPLSGLEKELLSLKTGQLDVVRQGVRVIMNGLQREGAWANVCLCQHVGCVSAWECLCAMLEFESQRGPCCQKRFFCTQ